MTEAREEYEIPDQATCLGVVSALVGDPVTAEILGTQDTQEDYDAAEVAEFQRVEAPYLQGKNVFFGNVDLLRALARRTVAGDFDSPDDPALVKFLSGHLLPFRTSLNFAISGRKMRVDDFLKIANLLLTNERYLRLVREHNKKRDYADLLDEAEQAFHDFLTIEFFIKRNLGYLDVEPYFAHVIVEARRQGVSEIDLQFLRSLGSPYLSNMTRQQIEW